MARPSTIATSAVTGESTASRARVPRCERPRAALGAPAEGMSATAPPDAAGTGRGRVEEPVGQGRAIGCGRSLLIECDEHECAVRDLEPAPTETSRGCPGCGVPGVDSATVIALDRSHL